MKVLTACSQEVGALMKALGLENQGITKIVIEITGPQSIVQVHTTQYAQVANGEELTDLTQTLERHWVLAEKSSAVCDHVFKLDTCTKCGEVA